MQLMPITAEIIISRYISRLGCKDRLLLGDGITASDFSIKNIEGVIAGMSVDSRQVKQSIPTIGKALSLAKNLDEYENKICKLVSSLPDSDLKLRLQKYRVGIVASFSRLVELIRHGDTKGVSEWSRYATPLLEEASDTFLKATTNPNPSPTKSTVSESLAYFGTPEDVVDSSLKSYYGFN